MNITRGVHCLSKYLYRGALRFLRNGNCISDERNCMLSKNELRLRGTRHFRYLSVLYKSIEICKTSKGYLCFGLDRAISSATAALNDNGDDKRMVWLDMEMTGLDVENSHILEIACLITDENLISVNNYLNIVIHQPNEVLQNMTDWCKIQHKKTGLIAACQSSKIMLNEAEEMMLKYLENHIPYKMCPLAGNSVHIDRMFLRKYMPLVNDYLHYRIVDVSTIRELARRWHPDICQAAPKKEYNHRAVHDVNDSINELHYYRQHMFLT